VEEEVDDGGQREAAAGALLPLVEDGRHVVNVDELVGEGGERRVVEPVADVDAVGVRVKASAGLALDARVVVALAARTRGRVCGLRRVAA
jgi:hypothetical protein